jgi:hypothetical protein
MTIAKEGASGSRHGSIGRRTASAALALLAFVATAAAQTPAAPSAKPETITPQVMDKRLQERATLIQKVNPEGADRVVIYDLRWPRDANEYKALGKHALLLIAAVTRNKKELPIKKVYLRIGEKDVVLQRVFTRRSDVAASSPIGRLFGTSREDALFLVPIGPLLAGQVVFADFALNRTEFRLTGSPLGPPAFIKDDTGKDSSSDPSPDVIKGIVERDYPGYSIGERRGSRRTSRR